MERSHSIQRVLLKVNGLVVNVVEITVHQTVRNKKPGSNIFLIPYNISKSTNTTVPKVHAQQVTGEASGVDLLNKIGYYNNKDFLNI